MRSLPLILPAILLGTSLFAQTPPVTPPAPAPNAPAATPAPPQPLPDGHPAAPVNAQTFTPGDPAARARMVLRAQVILDRQHFSPGSIDGKWGFNSAQALKAFQQANGLSPTGRLDRQSYEKLVEIDPAPVLRGYALTEADLGYQWQPPTEPGDYAAMAERKSMGWTSLTEWLAERAHMSEALFKSLNPNADLSKTGTVVAVLHTARTDLPQVAKIAVSGARRQLMAYDGQDRLVAAYPATVGSGDMPAPYGRWTVKAVAPDPTYTYDPNRLTFKDKRGTTEKLTIPAGPNNPVGATWIDLSKDTYGIHGTPHPADIGKTASHGCIRLTNWDAKELGGAVKAGIPVVIAR